MIDIINNYCNMIIKPIENHARELQIKLYSKNFFDWLNRGLYREYLEKTEEMLFEHYKKLSEIIEEEINFDNEIREKLEECKRKEK